MTQSFWLTDPVSRNLQTTPQLPTSSDVVVLGGGISGVSAAYWLSQFGVEVTLLEQRGLAEGATGRNGGHLAYGANRNFVGAIATRGLEETLAIWRFTETIANLIRQFVDTHHVDCDLHFNTLVSLALTPEEAQQDRQSFELMQEVGLAVDLWDAEQCAHHTHSSKFLSGLVFKNHAQVWAAKLVLAIAQVSLQSGVNIQTQTHVEAVEPLQNHLLVHTQRGAIQAKFVVHATNAYARRLRPILNELIIPVRGQALVTSPVPRLWEFDWIANQGYEYCIQRPDGRIVFGGMRWRSPTQEWNIEEDGALEPSVSQGLRNFLPTHFEALRDIQFQHEWTGIMGFSPDGNPLVGELPGHPGEYLMAGYTGNGTPFAFGIGKAIAEMIQGQEPELPTSFRATRFWS